MGLFKRTKNSNGPVFRQILDLIPDHILASVIATHKSDKYCSRYRTRDQLVSQTFGQLNKCYTLEDISAGIGVNKIFISDLGLSQSPARSTMSDGNAKRDWRVFEALYNRLLSYYSGILKSKHWSEVIEEVKRSTIKLIDSTVVSLCLNLFSWAKYRTAKGGLKIHTCFDDTLGLPDVINITEGKVSDIKGHPQRIFAKGTIIVEDRGYFDFVLMAARCAADNYFVTRIKDDTVYEVLCERPLPLGEDEHIILDQEIMFTSPKAAKSGIEAYGLRRVAVYDAENDRTIVVLTNNFEWKAATFTAREKRWDIELFFKAMKQKLQIKTFWGLRRMRCAPRFL